MGKEEPTELTFETMDQLNKNTYKKLFKKPATWKKAKGVLFFAKKKLSNGKLPLVAIPFKKYNEAAKCFKKDVKTAADYSAKLTMLATFEWEKGLDSNFKVHVTPMQGAMNLEFAETYGKELFGKLKVDFEVIGANDEITKEDLQELAEAAKEELSDKKAERLAKKQNRRLERIQKVTIKLRKFEKLMGRVDLPTLEAKLAEFKQILATIEEEAIEDGTVSADEQAEIDRLKSNIDEVEKEIVTQQSIARVPLTNEQRTTMLKGLEKMEKFIDKVIKKNNIPV